MGNIKLEQFVTFKFLGQRTDKSNFTEQILVDFANNYQKNASLIAFQEEIIEEKKILNQDFQDNDIKNEEKEENNDGETKFKNQNYIIQDNNNKRVLKE